MDRTIVSQQHPVAIEDEPPGRRQRLNLDAILLGPGLIGVVLPDLQLQQTEDQDEHEAAGQKEQHCSPGGEGPAF